MQDGADISAREICNRHLAATGRAMMAGDFEAFAPLFSYPMTMSTFETTTLIPTIEDMSSVFSSMRDYYASKGVTALERVCEHAEFTSPTTFKATHVSRLMAGDRLAIPEFPTLSTFVLENNTWKINGSQAAFTDPIISSRLTARKPLELNDIQVANLFQSVLDEITSAYFKGDAPALLKRLRLPLFLERRQGRQVLETPDDVLEDLAHYRREYTVLRITAIIRRVKRAALIGPDRMTGHYTSFVLSGTELVVPSYESSMTMHRDSDGTWQASSVMQALGHNFQTPSVNEGDVP